MKKFISIIILLSISAVFSQKKTCTTPEENLEDLNTITKTKCKIVSSSDKKGGKSTSKRIRVTVSAKPKFFRKNRKGELITTNKKGIATNQYKGKIVNSISISNLLSLEEVKKSARFIDVDQIPAFKNCKANKGDERIDCFNVEMVKHIEKLFQYPAEAYMKKIQAEVWVRFIIDKQGNVRNIKTHTSKKGKEMLKEEAVRVVSNLSKFDPAIKDGEPIAVKYGFPINFSLE